MSSELTKSRNTSRRGSTICSPVDLEGDPAVPSPSSSPTPPSAPSAAWSSTDSDDEDPAARPDREGQRIGRPGVDLDRPAVVLEQQPGVERLLGQGRDDHPIDARPEPFERRREQVVGERPVGGEALELHRDRARLPRPDPDREVAIPLGLLEDHDVAARQHVDPDALDDHLDELRPRERLLAGHGLIIPRRPGQRPLHRPPPATAGGTHENADDDTEDEPADVGEERDATLRPGQAERADAVDQLEDEPEAEDDEGGHLDQLVEEAEEDERQDPGARKQHEVRAEDGRDRAGRADHRDRAMSGRSRSGRSPPRHRRRGRRG